jgi:hypothetical protein
MSDETTTTAELLAEREEIFDLSLLDLRRRYIDQPVSSLIPFGEGVAQDTLRGNQEHPFYGVAILNPSPKTVYIGFAAGAAQGSPLFCPPGSALVWPGKYTELSLAVNAADANGPQATITVLRLQYPPEAGVFPYGAAPTLLNALTGTPEAQRTPTNFIAFPNGGTEVAGETVLWTPKAGKRFRVLGFLLESEATRQIELLDGAAGTRLFTIPLTGGITYPAPAMGNGIPSSKAGNALVANPSAGGKLQGSLWGTEE